MVPNSTTILPRFTGEWAMRLQPEAILTGGRAIGYTPWRDRELPPVTTRPLFLVPMLHGHTACRQLPHLSGLRCSAVAYWQARAQLPRRFLDLLLERCGNAVQRPAFDEGRWQGHRPCLVEGSGCSLPDTPAWQAAFGQPTAQRSGGGFPVARLLGRFHAGIGVLLKLVIAPLLPHDLAQVPAVHASLPEGAGLVADRGLGAYAPWALLVQAGVPAVRRVGARQLVDCTPGRPLVRPRGRRTPAVKGLPRSRWRNTRGVHAHLVTWLKPKTCPSWLTRETLAALPETLELREGRYGLGTPGCRTRQMTLVTTRREAEVSRVADLAELSRQRWQVETSRAPLKTTMPMDVLHGKTVPGVRTELTVLALVDNLVRMVICQSAALQHVGVERISFLDPLRWLSAPSPGIL